MDTHVVTRHALPIAGGKVLPPGTRVDARDWPNKEKLVKTGYLRALTVEDAQTRPIRGKV